MAFIDDQLCVFKELIEESIINGGVSGKQSMIRSSQPIFLVHDAVKYELIQCGVDGKQIFPHFGETKPEIKLTGYFKQKDQDVCVIPENIKKRASIIDWGPLRTQKKEDEYGYEFSDNTLVINVRSQMSSLAKNTDTLFERTFAESQNLHMRYPNMVMGEVYLIPVYEYDDEAAKNYCVGFKRPHVDVEKYISFFDSINNRKLGDHDCLYERCSLLVVDFNANKPKLYRNSSELKADGIISESFEIEYGTLDFDNFAADILDIYGYRHNINNLIQS